MNTESCDMRCVSDEVAEAFDLSPGDFCFKMTREDQRVMWICLPNGTTSVIRIRPYSGPEPSWEWDGNEEKPTLTPSIYAIGIWHGWARAGRLVSC